jgi:hypothetical protein
MSEIRLEGGRRDLSFPLYRRIASLTFVGKPDAYTKSVSQF